MTITSSSDLNSIHKLPEISGKNKIQPKTEELKTEKTENTSHTVAKDNLSHSKSETGKSNPNLSFHEKVDTSQLKKDLPKLATKTAVVTAKAVGTKVVAKAAKQVAKQGILEAAGKTTGKLIAEATSKAVIKSVGQNVIPTVACTVIEEAAMKVVEKGGKKVAEKGATKTASRIAAAVPFVGAVVEAGFTYSDAKYAYSLTKDPKASKISKVLAWSTVGLDVVSMVTTATGVGSAIGWAATGLSIATGVGADLTAYKK